MSADLSYPDGIIMRTEYINDDCLVDEIDHVDLSDLELDDNDDWLYVPSQCSTESTIHDLYAWLKTEPELDIRSTKYDSNKKCIDTRTFTRSKKRLARINFESIFEELSPSVKNLWKSQSKNVMHIEDEKSLSVTIEDKESVPLMLKPSKTVVNILGNESEQESMEAFLNISQSKGIDSFINLNEPEFNDLLMNVSQPSILYTSVTSSINEFMNSSFSRNDTMPVTANKKSSDMEEIWNSNSSINETFVMQPADETIALNSSYCTNILSNTFCKEPVQLDKDLNKTYETKASGETSVSQPSLDKENTDMATLSSTFVTEHNIDATFVQPYNKTSNDIKLLDTTYLSSAKNAEGSNLFMSTKTDTYKSTVHTNKVNLNVTCDIVTEEIKPATFLETSVDENTVDISFKVPICNQSTPMNSNIPNPTSKLMMKHPNQSRQTLHSMLKAPTSLRRELLAEIQRNDEHKLDSTYNYISSNHADARDIKENICVAYNKNETDVPHSNRYNMYKKSTLTTTMANQCMDQNETIIAQKELSDQRKFYTFTKKSNNYVQKGDNINTNQNTEIPCPKMDGTFCKPLLPKTQKRNVPRMLSKLPQFLQKSNPNLMSSSLKTGHASGLSVDCTGISGISYIKGSQPNIIQNIAEKSQLPSKLNPYGKLMSGSEQRLFELNVNTNNQFPMKGLTAGSMESIESTQSAHSAPDLDDRLSTCSDNSSHNSCRCTMNIEQLHELVRMQEESLKQETASKPNIRILENTWVEDKIDLPSPILKNGVEYSEIDRHSMLNTNLNDMKCSSPMISPIKSSHALNNDESSEDVRKTEDEVAVINKTEDSVQLVPKVESKTRLRQPTNWGTRSKPAAVIISGIPRPTSRIPALRFARPNAKATQGNLRKGCT